MAEELTLAVVWPDGVKLKANDEFCSLCENAGLKVVSWLMKTITREELEDLYREIKDRSYFSEFVLRMSSGPSQCLLISGENAVEIVRDISNCEYKLLNNNGPSKSIHGSKNSEAAKRELRIFFDPDWKTEWETNLRDFIQEYDSQKAKK